MCISLLDNGIYQCGYIKHRVWGFDLLSLSAVENKVKLAEVGFEPAPIVWGAACRH